MNRYQETPANRIAPSHNLKSLLLGASLAVLGATSTLATPIGGLWSTGVDDTGNPNPVGTDETHYATSTAGLDMTGYSMTTVDTPSAWSASAADARWIGPSQQTVDSLMTGSKIGLANDPVGTYFYDLTFSLGDFHAAEISGLWASDNASQVFLNGVLIASTPLSSASFSGLWSFSVNDVHLFNTGLNTLRFAVENLPGTEARIDPTTGTNYVWGNPSGLLVSSLRGEVTQSVPDGGATALLLGIGLLGLAAVRRRKA